MLVKKLLKNKWIWIAGGMFVFLTLISFSIEKKFTETYQKQQAEVLFPIKNLINKTPIEIEEILGVKIENLGKNANEKIMNANITLDGMSIETAYALVNHPKIKYNGTFFFNIWFDKPINEDEAWSKVGLKKPIKQDALKSKYMSEGCSNELFINNKCNKFKWNNISPFVELQAGYINNEIEFIECYLLSEKDTSLYFAD